MPMRKAALTRPLYSTTTYRFEKTADLLNVISGKNDGNLYTRWGSNPTIQELGTRPGSAGKCRGGAGLRCRVWPAISAALLAHGRNGIVCVGDLYGGTQELLKQCQLLGIPVTVLLKEQQTELAQMLHTPGMLVYCETPANPTLSILDITELAKVAHAHGALLAVDNTFASPINQQPLTLGADVVLHSASKYLGGHSDITAGALMASLEGWLRKGGAVA